MVVCVYGIIVVSISFALFSLMLILFQLSKQRNAPQALQGLAPQVTNKRKTLALNRPNVPKKLAVAAPGLESPAKEVSFEGLRIGPKKAVKVNVAQRNEDSVPTLAK
jgi:hypothetical protein